MRKTASSRTPRPPSLDAKLRELPPEKLAEVEDFVDFLRQKDEDEKLRRAVMKMSEPSFRRVWDNPIDAAYDKLRFRGRRPGPLPVHGSHRLQAPPRRRRQLRCV